MIQLASIRIGERMLRPSERASAQWRFGSQTGETAPSRLGPRGGSGSATATKTPGLQWRRHLTPRVGSRGPLKSPRVRLANDSPARWTICMCSWQGADKKLQLVCTSHGSERKWSVPAVGADMDPRPRASRPRTSCFMRRVVARELRVLSSTSGASRASPPTDRLTARTKRTKHRNNKSPRIG